MRVDSAGSGMNLWICFDIYGKLPDTAIVLDARLQLTVSSVATNNAGSCGIYRCLKEPVESQTTWNISKTGINWKTAGAKSESTTENDNDDATKADRRTEAFPSVPPSYTWTFSGSSGLTTIIPLGNSWFQGLVQGWIDGNVGSKRGLIFDGRDHMSPKAIDCTFHSSEASSWANRPRLYVKYRVPSTTGCARVGTWNRIIYPRGYN